jgi:hypothetical protein
LFAVGAGVYVSPQRIQSRQQHADVLVLLVSIRDAVELSPDVYTLARGQGSDQRVDVSVARLFYEIWAP